MILWTLLLMLIWVIAMLVCLLGGLWVIQVLAQEVFEVDILIRVRAFLQKKLAPEADQAFYGNDGHFYIRMPRALVDQARQLGNVKVGANKLLSIFKKEKQDSV